MGPESIKRRALVTGISGFTGKYVADELAQAGFAVYGTGTTDFGSSERYHRVSMEDFAGLRQVVEEVQPQAVVHLAAKAFVAHGNAGEFYTTNLIGTRNLLEALAGLRVLPECVVIASSANIYGNTAEGLLAETTTPNPANDYAVSKLAMEHMANLWRHKLPIVIVRPFNYTGVGQSENFVVAKIAAHYRHRAERIELGNLDVWRDFCDVRSVAQAYRRLVEVKPVDATVNICSGVAYSLRQVLGFAESITGHRLEVTVNPSFVRASEVQYLCGDPGLLRRLIGEWQPIPLQETLRWMTQAT
ncbi:MAG: GDP-mannose 4,6-dehydratase [Selenomonadales bacterium]|nr:GDP-mannose 4,6-dehydratase [Selenomonadales bacterium]